MHNPRELASDFRAAFCLLGIVLLLMQKEMIASLLIQFFLLSLCWINTCAFVPRITKGAVVSSASPHILTNQRRNEHTSRLAAYTDVSESDSDGLTVTRRNALLGIACSLPILTTVSYPPLAVAASDEPFTVLLTIQVDSNNPDELSEIEIECRPDWAPLAANRFRQLVELGMYKDCPFFRVLPGFIAQFGISADANLNKQWMYCDTTADEETIKLCKPPLMDEPRTQSNKKGTLSFASSGKNSRRTQVFINAGDNGGIPNFLDGQSFVPFARIVRGLEVVKQLNGEYGGKINQGKGAYFGGEYFEKVFPRLSVIRDAKVM